MNKVNQVGNKIQNVSGQRKLDHQNSLQFNKELDRCTVCSTNAVIVYIS